MGLFLKLENYLTNICFFSTFITMLYYLYPEKWMNQFNIHIKSKNILLLSLLFFFLLALRWWNSHHFPLSNRLNCSKLLNKLAIFIDRIIFLCWSLIILQIILESVTSLKWLGSIITPIILFLQTLTNFYLPSELKLMTPLIPALQSNWLIMHVSIMILSYAALICGSLCSISFCTVYYLQNKNFAFKLIYNLANDYQILNNISHFNCQIQRFLYQLDNSSYRMIGIGFPLLTMGILSGSIWANEAWGSYWSWDPKETWALITWLIFAIYLHTRYSYDWSGFKSSILGSFGFIIICICYMGVNLIGKGLHSYGWFK
uniref:Cytochrome c biogenesis protein CcsA n=1 Tax=Pedobesia claviformis TaxID=2364088 RepID=A0A386B0Q6_9CHLO|nr:cytochrome c biogenesis protein ccs1 [Pedobesia claviformis]AYC65282.1 cytochrome c biogenesis protein ccs1 [Pedobesia claviformis]